MRLLMMLATAVLLAGCFHDTDDYNLFVAESGASLTYYVGSAGKNAEELGDPWDEIMDHYAIENIVVRPKKVTSTPDDPWDDIKINYGVDKVRTGKSGEDDPWDTIRDSFSQESVHTGKTNDRYFLGFEKSTAVFVSFTYQESAADRARVIEVRGRMLKLEFADGVEQYVIDAPAGWVEGTQLVTGFLEATSKKDRPFLGVRVWRTMEGQAWSPQARDLASELQMEWPSEYYASGASLLVGLSAGQKSEEDPWDTITEKFGLETVHRGYGKAHDDPWDTINESFPMESVHTGKKKVSGFMGEPVSDMLFVSIDGEQGKEEDPWNLINELFPAKGNGETTLRLVEVRNGIGQFTTTDDRSIYAVRISADWKPGLALRGSAYLLESEKALPLVPSSGFASSGSPMVMGAVVWEVDRNLSLPKAN